jgi:hypothetical protein
VTVEATTSGLDRDGSADGLPCIAIPTSARHSLRIGATSAQLRRNFGAHCAMNFRANFSFTLVGAAAMAPPLFYRARRLR